MASKVSKIPRAEQWADRICTQVGKSAQSIIEVGRLLVQAKADLAHGEWGRLFEDGLIPFNRQWAHKIMTVAENHLLANVSPGIHLPPSVKTLYALAKAEPEKLKNALKDGVITPDMPRASVVALPPPKTPRPAKVVAFDVDAAVRLVVDRIQRVVARWPPDVSRRPLIDQLRHEADRYAEKPQ